MDSRNQTDGGIRILLIEDNSGFARLVERALAKMRDHFVLEHQLTLTGGLRLLQKERFDIVLLDLTLPDSRGLAGLMRVKRQVPLTPVVILTALDSEQLSLDAIDRGAQDYILKDYYHLDLLKQSIRHAIARQEKLLENKQLNESLHEKKQELEKKNARLAKLYTLIHQSLESISRDFSMPLKTLREATQQLADSSSGELNREQRALVAQIDRQNDLLKSLIDDLVERRKLEAGLTVPRRMKVFPDQILKSLREHLTSRYVGAGVVLKHQIAPDCPAVFCDPEMIRHAMYHLLASKGSKGETNLAASISVHYQEGSEEVVFEIDTSPTPTAKGQSPSSEAANGAPLGRPRRESHLSIAESMLRINLGRFSTASPTEKAGTFRFTLPMTNERKVTERYLEYIRSISDEETSVSSLLLEAPGPGGREEDLHEFLVSMLRQNDLLFPIGRFRWRLLLHANKMEREYYLLRLQREIAAADRHSPPRRLPELNVPSIETWKISPSREHRYEPSVLDALSHSNLLTATDRRNAEKRNSCLDHHFGEAFRPKPSDPSR